MTNFGNPDGNPDASFRFVNGQCHFQKQSMSFVIQNYVIINYSLKSRWIVAEYSTTCEAWRWMFKKPLFTEIEEVFPWKQFKLKAQFVWSFHRKSCSPHVGPSPPERSEERRKNGARTGLEIMSYATFTFSWMEKFCSMEQNFEKKYRFEKMEPWKDSYCSRREALAELGDRRIEKGCEGRWHWTCQQIVC